MHFGIKPYSVEISEGVSISMHNPKVNGVYTQPSIAIQQSELLRAEFMVMISVYDHILDR